MIFVTVGTHEQQFNRLVTVVDAWAQNHDEEVIIQTGFSTYEPKHAKWQKLFGYKEMRKLIEEARIIITHGGPSSFIAPLQIGKTPIVVPREKRYDEHVNDHQVKFCKEVENRMGTIIVVEDVEKLGETIEKYEELIADMGIGMKSNNKEFCEKLEKIVDGMAKGKK